MKDKKWILGLIVVIIVIAAISIWGFKKNQSKSAENSTQTASSEQPSENAPYYSQDAAVMEFYSDYCSWCIKQKDVLARLGDEGYRFKPMNVGKDTSLWQTYDVKGTPTFIAKNGDRLEGYQEYNELKTWLDQHK